MLLSQSIMGNEQADFAQFYSQHIHCCKCCVFFSVANTLVIIGRILDLGQLCALLGLQVKFLSCRCHALLFGLSYIISSVFP